MKSVKCPSCGAKMKRSGKTSAGRQRWRCPGCGALTTVRRDGDAAALREFLGWLMSKGSQREMPGQGRSFRRRTAGFWADFLEDTSVVDGRRVFTHESLRRARSSLSRLVSEGTLFTYLDPELTEAGPLRSTDNAAESLNARLRDMLRNHRGMSLMRRVKAVFWWCHMHSGDARTAAEKLATDEDIDFLYRTYSASPKREDGGPEWGDRAVWEELHHRDPFPWWLDCPTGTPVPSGHTFCPITQK